MDTVPLAWPPYFRCDLGKKAARATVIQTSVSDEINSSDNHSHDVIHSLHFSEKSKNHAPLLSNFHTTQSHPVGWTWLAVWYFILANTVSLNAGLVFWNLHNCLMWHTTSCTMLKHTTQCVGVCASNSVCSVCVSFLRALRPRWLRAQCTLDMFKAMTTGLSLHSLDRSCLL